jgi:hypothetical protein
VNKEIVMNDLTGGLDKQPDNYNIRKRKYKKTDDLTPKFLKLTAFNLYNNSVKLKIKEDEISEENRKNLQTRQVR